MALGERPRGLVPTMGALHDGHTSLIRRSAAENKQTVVSIFVNPTQFTDARDLAAYPRHLEMDAELAFAAGAELIYAPAVEEVYPPGSSTSVDPGPTAIRWEGEFRPGHFLGVATVVAILLSSLEPDRVYFGEKDYQQLCVIRRIARDLRLPGEVIGCPTARDADGLALSSRNARLSPEERRSAASVPRALFRMKELADAGMSEAEQLVSSGWAELDESPDLKVEYLAIVDPDSLEPVVDLIPGARALIAVRVGEIRLIDNLELAPTDIVTE
jgi:pantoate--beta-alanine ligase